VYHEEPRSVSQRITTPFQLLDRSLDSDSVAKATETERCSPVSDRRRTPSYPVAVLVLYLHLQVRWLLPIAVVFDIAWTLLNVTG